MFLKLLFYFPVVVSTLLYFYIYGKEGARLFHRFIVVKVTFIVLLAINSYWVAVLDVSSYCGARCGRGEVTPFLFAGLGYSAIIYPALYANTTIESASDTIKQLGAVAAGLLALSFAGFVIFGTR